MRISRVDNSEFGFNSNFVYFRMMNAVDIYLFNRYKINMRMPYLFKSEVDKNHGWTNYVPTKYNLYVATNIRKLFKLLGR